jgi:hypothetical protein
MYFTKKMGPFISRPLQGWVRMEPFEPNLTALVRLGHSLLSEASEWNGREVGDFGKR